MTEVYGGNYGKNMKKSIKATILAGIIAAGIGGATCGGLTTLNWPGNSRLMTNCQYNDLKAALFTKYPTGREIIEIDDWQMLLAVIDKEIKSKKSAAMADVNQDNLLEKLITQVK